jgi:enoyl-CoA hydratase
MPQTVELSVEKNTGVATVRLRRPEKLNALDRATLKAFVEAIDTTLSDVSISAVIVTGGSDAFCTGEDLDEVNDLSESEFEDQIADFQHLASSIRNAPKVFLAAMGGPAYGGGLEIALNCDLRIAADNARFACPEVRWGLTMTNGCSVLLTRVVGDSWARELALAGTEIDATKAHAIGLVTRVVSPEHLIEEANGLARTVASHSSSAVRASKDLLNSDDPAWQTALEVETKAVLSAFGSSDAKERLSSFPNRKKARKP